MYRGGGGDQGDNAQGDSLGSAVVVRGANDNFNGIRRPYPLKSTPLPGSASVARETTGAGERAHGFNQR